MRRRLKVAAELLLVVTAIALLAFSFDLFLVGANLALIVRLLVVLEQRDEAQTDLVSAWFTIAGLEQQLQHRDADAPFRRGKGTW